ncbi:hypothetical protein BV898_18263 [Hypsibius exemplaris]|uniref:Uncharacterized protein n=1 Tax=Hypsibius exemplaris TaxID=2072580 RepID=A0A9X6RNB6_HYPEX|nr:hypothetical protein BV898_18263 [Hypsibius exemplaris]
MSTSSTSKLYRLSSAAAPRRLARLYRTDPVPQPPCRRNADCSIECWCNTISCNSWIFNDAEYDLLRLIDVMSGRGNKSVTEATTTATPATTTITVTLETTKPRENNGPNPVGTSELAVLLITFVPANYDAGPDAPQIRGVFLGFMLQDEL